MDNLVHKMLVAVVRECLHQPFLDAEAVVPDDPLEERIDKADQQRRGDQLRVEARPLGDAVPVCIAKS